MKKNVTIIIPVYKDWTSLEKCITSLFKFLDERHQVFIINDNSSESEFLENKIKEKIIGHDNFFYFKNDGNIGFVKTCNRGFLLDKTDNDILLLNSDTEVTNNFLEEMLSVLYLSDKHGVCCPRSNNATILSIPLFYNNERNRIIYESYEYFKRISKMLPRFSVVPTGVGFCFLIKRNIIENFGLFDEIYGKGYNEENDFCCRINKYGYSAVMSNHSFVFHFEGKSFSLKERELQNSVNFKILNNRYPEYLSSVEKYLNYKINPVDYFSDIICKVYSKRKILFSLYNLPDIYNGTAEYGLSLLKNFISNYKDIYDITILVNNRGRSFHRLDFLYKVNIMSPEELEMSDVHFDLTIFPSQFFDMDQLTLLNRHSLKIIFSLQDIIAWRCNYLNLDNRDYVLKYSVMFSDGIIAISDFSKKDLDDYCSNIFSKREKRLPIFRTIYHGITDNISKDKINNKKFILVVGNNFAHKSIINCVQKIKEMPTDIIVLGIDKEDIENGGITLSDNIKCYKSGRLENYFVDNLYLNCSFVVFPSQYEGFGLPIIKAVSNKKKVVIFDNQLNRELVNTNDNIKYNSSLFSNFDELPEICLSLLKSDFKEIITTNRTWNDVSVETAKFVDDILSEDVNTEKLQSRWDFLNYLYILNREKKELNNFNSDKIKMARLYKKGISVLKRKGIKTFTIYLVKYIRYGRKYFNS